MHAHQGLLRFVSSHLDLRGSATTSDVLFAALDVEPARLVIEMKNESCISEPACQMLRHGACLRHERRVDEPRCTELHQVDERREVSRESVGELVAHRDVVLLKKRRLIQIVGLRPLPSKKPSSPLGYTRREGVQVPRLEVVDVRHKRHSLNHRSVTLNVTERPEVEHEPELHRSTLRHDLGELRLGRPPFHGVLIFREKDGVHPVPKHFDSIVGGMTEVVELLHPPLEVPLHRLVTLVSERIGVRLEEDGVRGICDFADFRKRVVAETHQVIRHLAKLAVPGKVRLGTRREEAPKDVEGTCLDGLLVDTLLLVGSSRVELHQVCHHFFLTGQVERAPLIEDTLGLERTDGIDERLVGEVDVAGRALLPVVEREVLDGLGDEHRDALDEDGHATAVADRLVGIPHVVGVHELALVFLVELFELGDDHSRVTRVERLKHGLGLCSNLLTLVQGEHHSTA